MRFDRAPGVRFVLVLAAILTGWCVTSVHASQKYWDVVHGPIVQHHELLPSFPVVIENQTIYPSADNQPWAIDLTFPPSPSAVRPRVIIRNIVIEPKDFYFRNFIRLVNAWLCEIDTVTLIAPSGLPEPLADYGLLLLGQSTDCKVRNLRVSHVTVCVSVGGEAEGTVVDSLTCVPAKYCVNAWPDSGGLEPGFWVVNSHCNTSIGGISLHDRLHWFLRDNLLYFDNHFRSDWRHPYYGVYIERSRDGFIENVLIAESNADVKKDRVDWTQIESSNIKGRAEFRKRAR